MRILALLLLAAPAVAAPPGPPTLDPPTVPSADMHTTRLVVPVAGRYSIQAHSPQGVALTLEDRLELRGPTAGRAGAVDGRLDVLLDEGEYRVRTHGAHGAAGDATLSVQAFAETGPEDEELEDGVTLEGTLADLQARAWWIRVPERRQEVLEATGRSLTDLRLWKDGQWLVDAQPRCTQNTARPGEPRTTCSLWPTLEPGWYRLMSYGGAPLAWAQDQAAGRDALHVRRGIPELASAGTRRVVVGPFGVERFRVPTGLGRVRWVMAEIQPVELGLGPWNPGLPIGPAPTVRRVDAQSRAPEAEVFGSAMDSLITVTAEPGRAGALRWLKTTAPTRLQTGTWLATVVHTAGADDLAPGALWVRSKGGQESLEAPALVQLGVAGLGGRFNLVGESEIFIDIAAPGTWTFAMEGGRLRVEPWWTRPPPNYATPMLQPTATLPLVPGRYRVTLNPDQPGEVGLHITGTGTEQPLARPLLRWDALKVDPDSTLTLQLPKVAGQEAVLVARKLPLDLRMGLPVPLAAGETLVVPVQGGRGLFRATRADGHLLPLSLGGLLWGDTVQAPPDGGVLMIRNDAETAVDVELALVPLALVQAPPRLTAAQRGELPNFPLLKDTAATDLANGATGTWLVEVPQAGLYVLESTGLLATVGTLRTRVRTQLIRAQSGGAGRNFALGRYLGPGTYQLTVGTQGRSAGHLGLRLGRTDLVESGALGAGGTGRLTLPANTAAVYDLQVEAAADGGSRHFRLQSGAADRTLGCRVEDGDGYPVVEGRCEHTLVLAPGAYRIFLLPEPLATTRVTTLQGTDAPPQRKGAGPFVLPFDTEVVHTWEEPDAGAERAPQMWTFALQGPTPVRLSLSAAVTGLLTGPGFQLRLPPGRTWNGPLAAGAWRLEVTAVHADDGAEYALLLEPRLLVVGAGRSVSVGETVQFSVGESSLYTLMTAGTTDVRLTVTDAQGHVVGAADDRPDDWNARLSMHLAPGEYSAAVGGGRTYESVALSLSQVLPEATDASLAGQGLVRPLPAGGLVAPVRSAAAVVVAWAEGEEHLGLALEARVGDGWRTLAEDQGFSPRVALRPAADGPELRVRVWSLDDRGRPVRLRLAPLEASTTSESRLATGIASLLSGQPHIALKPLLASGVFAVSEVPAQALVCLGVGTACRPLSVGSLPVGPDGATFVVGAGQLKARRVALSAEPTLVPVDAAVALVNGPSGVGPTWFEAAAPLGQPGLALVQGATTLTAGAAAALDLAGTADTVGVWSADGVPQEVRVTARRLAAAPEVSLQGDWAGEVPAGGVLVLRLPGVRAVRALLGHGAGLLAGQPEQAGDKAAAAQLVWAARATRLEDLPQATGLVLVNPTQAPVPCAVALSAPQALPAPLAFQAPLERLPARAGSLRVPVVADAAGHIRLLGAQGHYRRADGRLLPAEGAEVGPGGELAFDHGRGPVVAWVERGAGTDPWPSVEGAAMAVGGPQSVALSGPHRLAVALPGPGLLTLRAPPGTLLRVRPVGGVEAAALDGSLDAWLPSGQAEVLVRGLAGQALAGALEVDVQTPLELGEGLGPTVLLAPGDTQIFRFATSRRAQVGLGARGEVDRLQARLLDPQGAVVAQGGTLMPDLEVGTWLVALHLPEDAPPAIIRPAVVGLAAPPDTPPPNIVRSYVVGEPVEADEPDEDATWRSWEWEGDVEAVPETESGEESEMMGESEDSEVPVSTRRGALDATDDEADAGVFEVDDTETDAAPAPGDDTTDEPNDQEATPENTEDEPGEPTEENP